MAADLLTPEPADTTKQSIGGGLPETNRQPSWHVPRAQELAKLAQQVKAAQALKNTPWDALTVEQKLERMRQVLKDLDHTVRWHSNRMQELSERLDALSEHAHAEGKVLVPMISKMRGGTYGSEAQEKKVEGWF